MTVGEGGGSTSMAAKRRHWQSSASEAQFDSVLASPTLNFRSSTLMAALVCFPMDAPCRLFHIKDEHVDAAVNPADAGPEVSFQEGDTEVRVPSQPPASI